MKGHMQDGKFHPHTPYKKTRMKRLDYTDKELVENIGVKLHKNNSGAIVRMAREVIFQDDPDAIPKLEKKLEDLEKQRAYWKTVKKTVPRDYSATEGDRKWFMPQLINTNIRTVKKKIETIKERKEKGIELKRKTTFKEGRKVFYYEEVEPVGKVREARDSKKRRKGEENYPLSANDVEIFETQERIIENFRKLDPDKFDKFEGVHASDPFIGDGNIFDGMGNEFKIDSDVIRQTSIDLDIPIRFVKLAITRLADKDNQGETFKGEGVTL